jgi:hypothetical protein
MPRPMSNAKDWQFRTDVLRTTAADFLQALSHYTCTLNDEHSNSAAHNHTRSEPEGHEPLQIDGVSAYTSLSFQNGWLVL